MLLLTPRKRALLFAAAVALVAGNSFAAMKNIAVVETEVDPHSGASAELTPAERAIGKMPSFYVGV